MTLKKSFRLQSVKQYLFNDVFIVCFIVFFSILSHPLFAVMRCVFTMLSPQGLLLFCDISIQPAGLSLFLSSNTYFRCEYVYISCLLSLPAHFPSVAIYAMFSCGVQSVYGADIECEMPLTSLPIPYWGQQVKRNVLNW